MFFVMSLTPFGPRVASLRVQELLDVGVADLEAFERRKFGLILLHVHIRNVIFAGEVENLRPVERACADFSEVRGAGARVVDAGKLGLRSFEVQRLHALAVLLEHFAGIESGLRNPVAVHLPLHQRRIGVCREKSMPVTPP